ncbi:MAG: beta-hydroxyacyl-ACP dehydratase [Deferribacteres bacterium]|nr:beta-hydroxyacyl-ACP dehydratase [candidate division KSB1 bacterium]MCB9503477.1 beta-hydroxyacyl-ACP dehydratase [Deferribacteres bacterium]
MAFTKEEILALVPQQPPFRFIDEIIDLDDEGIVATYTFKENESFYEGHFPGNPITPGVILLETMAQTGVVAYGLYLASKSMSLEEIQKTLTVFTDAEVEFTGMVRPGDKVIIKAQKLFFRRLKLKAQAEIRLENGEIVCSGTIAGIGVKSNG